MEELARTAGPEVAQGRIILAHLGNGSSMAAIRGGKSIDTSMAFTPTAGFPMSTRSGDLDPGLIWFLGAVQGMTIDQFYEMVNRRSGLLGVSETTSDMRELLAKRAGDHRAAEAIDLFCYQIKKWIGGFVAALGGLDTLVFTGGIGENAAEVRAGICARLECLGIVFDDARNAASAAIISADQSPVTVRVMRTDEEMMIAKSVSRLLPENGVRSVSS
jgi:acetate kinase